MVDLVRHLRPSRRSELEITDLGRGFAWLDTGTPDSLLEAGEFVRVYEKRQGFRIACPEEIALSQGWIDTAQFLRQAEKLPKSTSATYLLKVRADHDSGAGDGSRALGPDRAPSE